MKKYEIEIGKLVRLSRDALLFLRQEGDQEFFQTHFDSPTVILTIPEKWSDLCGILTFVGMRYVYCHRLFEIDD